MEDYFEKTIPILVSRIENAFGAIPKNLSTEQVLLASKCEQALNVIKEKLLRLGRENAPLREFQRLVRDIDYIEGVGIAALERSNEVDEKLNRLLKKVRHEIKYPLRLPPAITAFSKDYFYVHTRFNFNLICVPPGERNSLLHLPDLYHELAHPLLTEKNLSEINPFKNGLRKIQDLTLAYFSQETIDRSRQRGPQLYKTQPNIWLRNWYQSWATEFLCDLFAVYTLGPAFVWSHYHLCAKKTVNPFEVIESVNSTHPADNARMEAMLFALDRIGFTSDANAIEEKWKELIKPVLDSKELEYSQCYPRRIIAEVESLAFEAVARMNVRIVSLDTSDYIHSVLNTAWKMFWENPSSYIEWERNQVERLYEYCKDSSDTRADSSKVINRTQETIQSIESSLLVTQTHFQTSLAELLHNLKSANDLLKQYSFLDSNDLYKLELVFQNPMRGGIYDHIVFERKFYLSDELIKCFDNYWTTRTISDEQKKRMCKLFFLHEFFHTPQHVDSNTYPYSKNSKNSFRRIDYDADAFAVRGCYETESSYLPWHLHLAEILISHVKGGEVFALADDGRSSNAIDGDRLERQAIWHLQYARARVFNPESDSSEFYLERQIELEIFRVLPDGERENLCLKDSVSLDDLNGVLELNISWGGNRIRHSMTNKHFVDSFARGVFQCDFDATSEAFRALFDSNPELIGRGNNKLNVTSQKLSEVFDRVDFVEKLYALLSNDVGKIINAIPNANQKVSPTDSSTNRLEQLLSWADSGLGPGMSEVYKIAKKLHPTYFS